jgi:hypothetical protein
MRKLFRKTITHPTLALGSTVLWGLLEFVALQGVHRTARLPHWWAKQTDSADVTRLKK